MQFDVTYTELKSLIAIKELTWQHLEFDDSYAIYAVENFVMFNTVVYKATKAPKGEDQTQHDTDRTDFETNYKVDSFKTAPLRVDPIASERWQLKGDAISGSKVAPGVKNLDYKLPEDLYVKGGLVLTENAVLGDWAKIQVIDIDGIVSPPMTVLSEFVTKWYADPNGQILVETPMASKVLKDLYVRCAFTTTGTGTVKMALNLLLFKKLH